MNPDPQFRSFFRKELSISVLMNGLVPSVAVYFTYNPLPIQAWGSEGFVVFAWRMIPVVSFGMTLIMTKVMRMRLAKGGVPGALPARRDLPWLRWCPRALWLRGLVMALVACAVVAPLCALLAWCLPWATLDRFGFSAYVFIAGAAIGLIVTPPVMLAALVREGKSSDKVHPASFENLPALTVAKKGE